MKGREGISEQFPDEDMIWLVRIAVAFDLLIIGSGLAFAASRRVAGGLGVAAIGCGALLAVTFLVLHPSDASRRDRPGGRPSAGVSAWSSFMWGGTDRGARGAGGATPVRGRGAPVVRSDSAGVTWRGRSRS
jgi:hypothetical protein